MEIMVKLQPSHTDLTRSFIHWWLHHIKLIIFFLLCTDPVIWSNICFKAECEQLWTLMFRWVLPPAGSAVKLHTRSSTEHKTSASMFISTFVLFNNFRFCMLEFSFLNYISRISISTTLNSKKNAAWTENKTSLIWILQGDTRLSSSEFTDNLHSLTCWSHFLIPHEN